MGRLDWVCGFIVGIWYMNKHIGTLSPNKLISEITCLHCTSQCIWIGRQNWEQAGLELRQSEKTFRCPTRNLYYSVNCLPTNQLFYPFSSFHWNKVQKMSNNKRHKQINTDTLHENIKQSKTKNATGYFNWLRIQNVTGRSTLNKLKSHIFLFKFSPNLKIYTPRTGVVA